MKRLDGLDLLLTDWMLGFSILLLIAIRFAPGLVGKQVDARSIDLPAVFKVHPATDPLLTAADFNNPTALMLKLRDAHDPISKHLREKLSSETLAQLQKYQGSDPRSTQLFESLIEQLNLVLKGSSIFDEQRFAQVSLNEETRRFIAQNPEGNDRSYLNRLLLEQAYPKEIFQMQRELVAEAGTMQTVEVCPRDNKPLKDHWCETCKKNYPIQLVNTWPQKILFFLLLLFVVKYIHERSVLRFRLYEDEGDQTTETTFGAEMQNLKNRSNNAWLHFVVFIFRIAFLGTFYLFLINLYLKSNGQFQDFKDAAIYAAVLICAYFAPDICLFVATKGDGYQALKGVVLNNLVMFLGILIAMFLLCFFAIWKWQISALLGFLVFLIALLVFLGFWSVSALRRFQPYSIEITALKWLLLDVFNVMALILFIIATNMQKATDMQKFDVTWIACGVFIVNVLDWFYNRRFYFSALKFSIHAKAKTVA